MLKNLSKYVALAAAIFIAGNAIAQPLQADGGGGRTMCEGETITLLGGAMYGQPPYSYSWTPAAIFADPNVQTPQASPTTTTTVTLTVTDALSAVATNTLTISVNAAPTVDPVSNITTCNTVTTTVSAFSGSVAGATYNWTNSDPGIGLTASGTGNIPLFNAINNGSTPVTATISVTATNTSTACTGPVTTFQIIVNPSQSATFSYPTSSYCSNDADPLPTFGTGASGGTFSSTTGLVFVSVLTGEIDLSASTPGSYTITNTLTASSSCPGTSASTSVTISAPPTISAVGGTLFSCVGAPVSFTSNDSGGFNYLWTFDDGGTATTAAASHAYSTAGTYHASIQSTGISGCVSDIDTIMVYVYALPVISSVTSTDVTCNSFCNGTATAVASGSGGLTYYWPGFGSSNNPATGLCPGSSSVQVMDANGCMAMSSSVTIAEPPVLINTTSGVVSSCAGDSAQLWASGSGGIPPYYYTWDSGSGPVIMPDTIMALGPISFTVSVRDANNCAGSASAGVSVMPSTDISGHITTSGGTLSTGTNTVVLLQYMSYYTSMDTVMVDTLDASGNYLFTAVPSDDYIIKVFPDAAAYPLIMPTYSEDQSLWDSASVINHSCTFTTTANVTMVEGVNMSGTGTISGHVLQGNGFLEFRVPGDPVPGIDVKLGRNPGGQMMAQTETDGNGGYTFFNVPINTGSDYYPIYVDIPGMERDSVYNITLTSGSDTYSDLDYEVDSNSVWPVYPVSTSVKNPSLTADVQFSVYPNPSGGSTTISYLLKTDANVQLDVYDVLGKKVESLVNTNQQDGAYKVNLAKLNAGVYFITLNVNNNSNTTRLVVID